MDISQLKIRPLGKVPGQLEPMVQVDMTAEVAERFKLFCLVDYYIGKNGQNWELNKTEARPDGRVVLYVQLTK